ncbi:MAG: DNA internalization-related competence protein ComEC/Rec2 [Bacillota bacterium]
MNFFKFRPMILVFVYLIAGIISIYFFNFTVIIAVIVFLLLISTKIENKKFLYILLVFYFIGVSLILFEEYKYNSSFSVSNWNGKENLQIIGVIKEDLQNINGNKIYLKPLIINNLEIKYGKIELDKRYLPFEVKENEIYSGKFSLREPAGIMNPGEFSYKDFLKKKEIFSKGYYEDDLSYKGQIDFDIKILLINIKKYIVNKIDKNISSPYNNIIKALLLGERKNLPEKWEEKFTLSGTNHLLAISGLHIGFILIILLQLTKVFKISNIKLKNILITVILIIYIFLTGFRASVFRAGILAIFYLWAKFFNREADIFNIIALTAIINILINPYAPFEVGFQLSYIVLLSIILWQPPLKKVFHQSLSVSISAQLGSLAITAYYFNLISPVGIITNLWAIPLTGLIIMISILSLLLSLIFPFLFNYLNLILKLLLTILYEGMKYTADFSFGNFEIATPDLWLVILFYFVLFISPFLFKKRAIKILKRKNYFYRKIFIIFLILVLVFNFINNPSEKLEIIFFSVGQGDSILLDLPTGEKILIDGGGKAGMKSDQGEVVLLPYLKHKGIKKIDLGIITHFDTDHALGIISLLKENKLNALLIPKIHSENHLYQQANKLAVENGIKIYKGQRGDLIKNGRVLLSIIHPYLENNYLATNRNNNSIVLKVDYYNFSLLLTGDLEKEGELRLVNSGDDLKSQILKLGHHGSNSSSSMEFLEKVKANEAIISVGENNYGHPDKAVIDRINEFGMRKWVTKEAGAIIIKTDGYSYNIESIKK